MLEKPEPPDTPKNLSGEGVDFAQLWGEIAAIADELHDRAIQAGLSPEQTEYFNQLIGRMGIIVNNLVKQVAEGKITPEQCVAELRETIDVVLAPAQK